VYWDANADRAYTEGVDVLLAGAQLSLTVNGKPVTSMATAADGAYRFALLDPRTYLLVAQPPLGFALRIKEVVVPVQANRTTSVDLVAEIVATLTPTPTATASLTPDLSTPRSKRVYLPILIRR
jgi:hypothetical protein